MIPLLNLLSRVTSRLLGKFLPVYVVIELLFVGRVGQVRVFISVDVINSEVVVDYLLQPVGRIAWPLGEYVLLHNLDAQLLLEGVLVVLALVFNPLEIFAELDLALPVEVVMDVSAVVSVLSPPHILLFLHVPVSVALPASAAVARILSLLFMLLLGGVAICVLAVDGLIVAEGVVNQI